jgi:hypothetical protein
MRTPLARVRFAVAVLEGEVDERLHLQLRAVSNDVQQIDDLIPTCSITRDSITRACAWTARPLPSRRGSGRCSPHARLTSVTSMTVHAMSLRDAVDGAAPHGAGAEQPAGECAALRAANVRIEVARENGLCRLVVEDDGEGIPETHRASYSRPSRGSIPAAIAKPAGSPRARNRGANCRPAPGRVVAGSSASLGGARLTLEWPER